jgi:hypothetical protein
MKVFGRAAVSEYLGDRIVYRNLSPVDERLPSLSVIQHELFLPPGSIPRKSEADYARVVVHLLLLARALDAPGTPLKRLIFIGDTRLNDGTAFANICRAGEWPGLAFIGSENTQPASVGTQSLEAGLQLYLSNRWSALDEFDRFCTARELPIDEHAAVVIDLDKTALGARGRNAHVIDQARVAAVKDTVAGLLGDDFEQDSFLRAYDQLNQVEFHPFTADNQDYLAYICLILGSGLYEQDSLISQVRAREMTSFRQFIDQVDEYASELSAGLAAIHAEIYANVRAGDPTPFKPFRRNEYLATVQRMGFLDDEAPVEQMLAEEIVLTQEVRQLAQEWQRRGALLFGLSDKPDEASLPTLALAHKGYHPIHQTVTHAVGDNRTADITPKRGEV